DIDFCFCQPEGQHGVVVADVIWPNQAADAYLLFFIVDGYQLFTTYTQQALGQAVDDSHRNIRSYKTAADCLASASGVTLQAKTSLILVTVSVRSGSYIGLALRTCACRALCRGGLHHQDGECFPNV